MLIWGDSHLRALMDAEMTPTLSLPPGVDLTAYKDALRKYAGAGGGYAPGC